MGRHRVASNLRVTRPVMVAVVVVVVVVILVITGCSGQGSNRAPAAGQTRDTRSVLVFTRTTAFRHASIEDGVAAIRRLDAANGFSVEATEDPTRIEEGALERFQVVVFLSSTGEPLDPTQRASLRRWVESGGGWVGVHAAADAMYDWPWYGELVGTWFRRHPSVQRATVRITDRDHPSTRSLPAAWTRTDEWYNFRDTPRGRVQVLAVVDESSYRGGGMGRRPPGQLVSPAGSRPFLVHGARPHQGELVRTAVPCSHPGRDPVGRRQRLVPRPESFAWFDGCLLTAEGQIADSVAPHPSRHRGPLSTTRYGAQVAPLGALRQRKGEGQATMQASEVRRAVAAAMSTASSLDLTVDDAIVLHDSNKLTLRLLPCDVLARVAPVAQQVAQLEVELAQRLAESGCPVAALEPRVAPRIYERDGFVVTLWAYYEPVTPREVAPADYAKALERLHAGMRKLDVPTPHFTNRVEQAQQLVANRDHTPALADADRELLGDTLRSLRRVIGERGGAEQLLHGEPHPGNVLTTKNGLLFIDLETCCRGPVEFDLAHAPAAVSQHYRGVNQDLLGECRILVLAMITTWRWDRGDQLPNGRQLGTQWLSQIRAALDRNGLDTHG